MTRTVYVEEQVFITEQIRLICPKASKTMKNSSNYEFQKISNHAFCVRKQQNKIVGKYTNSAVHICKFQGFVRKKTSFLLVQMKFQSHALYFMTILFLLHNEGSDMSLKYLTTIVNGLSM